jgi:homoserine kinase type II
VEQACGAEEDLASVAGAVGAWAVGAVEAAAEPTTGTVNRTVLLTATRGRFALRGYRHRDRARVDREHAVIAYAAARGVPAIAPLPLPGGGTVLEREGRYFALFPWAPGRQVARADVGEAEAAAMGAALGRLHGVLHRFPTAGLPRRWTIPDRGDTLARMARLEGVIRAGLAADPLAAVALERLAGQRAHLEQQPAIAVAGGASPATTQPEQALHGDYQETNLFFAGGRVSAIIDWDQTAFAAPAWEVVRTLDLVFDFEPVRSRRFLDAYRAERPLPLADLDAAATAYDLRASRSLWVYETLYLEGDRRVARYLQEGNVVPFVPVAQRWAGARAAFAPE